MKSLANCLATLGFDSSLSVAPGAKDGGVMQQSDGLCDVSNYHLNKTDLVQSYRQVGFNPLGQCSAATIEF